MRVIAGAKDEPSTHLTRALQEISGDLNDWNRQILVLFPTASELSRFDKSRLASLNNIHYGVDLDNKIAGLIAADFKTTPHTLPLALIADSFGRVVYFSQGYNTSLAIQATPLITTAS